MPNIKLTISYDGTNYHGWQKQKNKATIQGILEIALKKILKKKINLTGAGRTDAGTHAIAQVANFKIDTLSIPLTKLPFVLNRLLPDDVRVTSAEVVNKEFHARKSAKSKTYLYVISNNPVQSPFSARYSWHIPCKLNLNKMREAAKVLIGKRDFKSFMSSGTEVKSTMRAVKRITIKQRSSEIIIAVEAEGFLKQMVRNIVGSLVEVGRGKKSPESLRRILLSKDRKEAGICAPARGLFLVRVDY